MEKCYNCEEYLIGEYQVEIYNPDLQVVKCCCMSCAEEVKKRNEEILKDRLEAVKKQSIQVIREELKKELFASTGLSNYYGSVDVYKKGDKYYLSLDGYSGLYGKEISEELALLIQKEFKEEKEEIKL